MAFGVYASAVFFFCSWVVLLGGLSSLQSSCNDAGEELISWAQSKNLTNLAAYFQRVEGYAEYDYDISDPVCARVFSFQWFILFWALIMGMLATGCAAPSFARVIAGGVQSNLSALLVLFIFLSHKYNDFLWKTYNDLPSTLLQRLNVTLAGYILLAIACVCFMFGISGRGFQGVSVSLPTFRRGSRGASDRAADPETEKV